MNNQRQSWKWDAEGWAAEMSKKIGNKKSWLALCDEWLAKLEEHNYNDSTKTAELLGTAHAIIAAVKHGWLDDAH